MFATFSPKFHSQSPITMKFKKPVSFTDIAALKLQIEGIYRVNFNYTGVEFDYDVTVDGSIKEVTKAINFLYPKEKPGILIGRSQF